MSQAIANLRADLGLNSAQFSSGLKRSDQLMRKTTGSMNFQLKSFENKTQKSFRRAAQATAAFQGPLGGVAGRLSSLGSIVGANGVAFAGGALAVTGFAIAVGKAISVSNEFERSQFRVGAVLKATGQASGQTSEGIREFSRQLARDTLAGTLEVEKAAAILLTFRGVAGETFKRTLTLAQDLAAAGFGNLQTNALQLGKALQDPVRGLTALSRSGVTFSDAQKDIIKQLVETGQSAKAQVLILDELQKQVGGAGKGEGAGLSGSFDSLAQSIEETFIAIDKLTGSKDKTNAFIQSLDQGLQRLNAALNPMLDQRIFDETDKLYDLMEKRSGVADQLYRELPKDVADQRLAALDAEISKQDKIVQGLIRQKDALIKKEIEAGKAQERAAQEAETERTTSVAREASNKTLKESAKELERHTAKIEAVAEAMEFEAAIRGKTAEQIAVMNALRRAEIDHTDVIVTKNGELVGTYDEMIEKIATLAKEQEKAKQEEEKLKDQEKDRLDKQRKGQQVTEELRTAQEKYNDTLEELDDLYKSGAINTETWKRGQKKALQELTQETDIYSQSLFGAFDTLAQQAVDGELTWKSFAKVAISSLSSIIEKAFEAEGSIGGALDRIFSDLFGGHSGGGLFGDLFGGLGSLFGFGKGGAPLPDLHPIGNVPGFAKGGRPPINRVSMVGEKGPELFEPDTAGTIIPNDKLMGGGLTIYADLRGADVGAVKRLEAFVQRLDGSIENRAIGAVGDAAARNQIPGLAGT